MSVTVNLLTLYNKHMQTAYIFLWNKNCVSYFWTNKNSFAIKRLSLMKQCVFCGYLN